MIVCTPSELFPRRNSSTDRNFKWHKDLFAHFSEIKANGFRSLQEGQKVEFVVKQGAKGPQASEIKPI